MHVALTCAPKTCGHYSDGVLLRWMNCVAYWESKNTDHVVSIGVYLPITSTLLFVTNFFLGTGAQIEDHGVTT